MRYWYRSSNNILVTKEFECDSTSLELDKDGWYDRPSKVPKITESTSTLKGLYGSNTTTDLQQFIRNKERDLPHIIGVQCALSKYLNCGGGAQPRKEIMDHLFLSEDDKVWIHSSNVSTLQRIYDAKYQMSVRQIEQAKNEFNTLKNRGLMRNGYCVMITSIIVTISLYVL